MRHRRCGAAQQRQCQVRHRPACDRNIRPPDSRGTGGIIAGKVTPAGALLHKHKASKEVKRIFRDVHDREERYELNLYVVGEEEEVEA